MKRKKRRLLIVDASVMCSASETEHPVSSACRACLEAIRDICHRVAVTPPVREEWRRYMSWFARTWLHQMAARRKPLEAIEPAAVPINVEAYTGRARAQIEKDMHLLEAALAADRIIVTRDDSLKRALMQRPDGAALLHSIRWVNPVPDGETVLQGL